MWPCPVCAGVWPPCPPWADGIRALYGDAGALHSVGSFFLRLRFLLGLALLSGVAGLRRLLIRFLASWLPASCQCLYSFTSWRQLMSDEAPKKSLRSRVGLLSGVPTHIAGKTHRSWLGSCVRHRPQQSSLASSRRNLCFLLQISLSPQLCLAITPQMCDTEVPSSTNDGARLNSPPAPGHIQCDLLLSGFPCPAAASFLSLHPRQLWHCASTGACIFCERRRVS